MPAWPFVPAAALLLLTTLAPPAPQPAAPPITSPAVAVATSAPLPPPEVAPPITPVGDWVWPLSPRPAVVNGFWVGPAPWSPGHRGVDLATVPRAVVRAPAEGVVRFAGVVAGRGVLTIDHGGGAVSSFEPVSSTLRPGTTVRRGEAVAVVTPPPSGRTHCFPQTCLHWGVRQDGVYVDPLTYLAAHGPAVLLPLGHP